MIPKPSTRPTYCWHHQGIALLHVATREQVNQRWAFSGWAGMGHFPQSMEVAVKGCVCIPQGRQDNKGAILHNTRWLVMHSCNFVWCSGLLSLNIKEQKVQQGATTVTYMTNAPQKCQQLQHFNSVPRLSIFFPKLPSTNLTSPASPHHLPPRALSKLYRFSDAAEIDSLDAPLDFPRFHFELYASSYLGRFGSVIPFAHHFLHVDLSQRLGDWLAKGVHYTKRKFEIRKTLTVQNVQNTDLPLSILHMMDLELVLEKEKALGVCLFCVIDVESRDSRASGGSTVSPPPLLEDQVQLLLLSLLVPTAFSALSASRAPDMADSAPAANSAIQASLESNEISEQIIDKGDSVTNNLIEDGNLLHKSKKQKRSLVWSDMIEVEDPKGDKYK
ncbi:hypothetical protein ZIOFF_003623 [Zingiber officinale]|uniref:Uncharacterized protein n=1 Tax=Zingiber officinale TaxID=94328 RepID=A0A8J5MAP1_ZINOF|nr:hypothetical protein ZIOFF_003623 [Zingiber officinale]